jgi:hypothetical protein
MSAFWRNVPSPLWGSKSKSGKWQAAASLLIEPEDEGSIFLPDYIVSHPRSWCSSQSFPREPQITCRAFSLTPLHILSLRQCFLFPWCWVVCNYSSADIQVSFGIQKRRNLLKCISLEDQKRSGKMIIYFTACDKCEDLSKWARKIIVWPIHERTFFLRNCTGHVWR